MVLNGMIANQTTFNTAFVSRTAATTSTAAIVSLINTAIASGASVNNVQALLNKLIEGIGTTGETDADINNYASNNYVIDGQSRKEAIESLDAQLFSTQSDLDVAEAAIAAAEVDILALMDDVDVIKNQDISFTGIKTFTGDVIVTGSFTTTGPTNTSSATDITDVNVTLNKNGNDLTSEGSGLTVDRTGTKGSFIYGTALTSKWALGALGAEAEVVTVSHAQTITNKTLTSPIVNGGTFTTVSLVTPNVDIITATEQGSTPSTPAAGVRKIYAKADGFYQLDSAGLETKVGSGSGSGGAVNLIPDGDAEQGIASYVEGSYAAASRPAGTFTPSAGTGALVISTTTSAPINSTKSFLITKSAGASRQGRAIERTITLDREYLTKVLKMRVKFSVVSGTFVAGSSSTDSSMIFYIGQFNGTTWTYTEPSSFKALSSSTLVDYVDGTFQVNPDTTQIKLISYVAETANSAWVLMCEYEISPSTYVYGTPFTDWQAYTPTFVGLGTPTGVDFRWRRAGQSVEIEGRMTNGTVTAVAATVSLPAGLVGSPANGFVCGDYGQQGSATGSYMVYAPLSNNLFFGMANWQVQATGTQLATGCFTSLNASVPILGWSSSVQMSDSSDTRVVAARYTLSATQSIPDNTLTTIVWNSLTGGYDTHGAMNTTNGRYTFTSAGKFRFSTSYGVLASIAIVATNRIGLYYRLNGGVERKINFLPFTGSVTESPVITGSDSVDVIAGDYIEIRAFMDFGGASYNIGSSTGGVTYFAVEKVQGPQAIAATESVNCRYVNTSGQSMASAANPIITNWTRQFDTHGAFNATTGIFTAPIKGVYRISSNLTTTSTAFTVSANRYWQAQVKDSLGNVVDLETKSIQASFTGYLSSSGSATVTLNAGETAGVYAVNQTGVTVSLITGAADNWVDINKIG